MLNILMDEIKVGLKPWPDEQACNCKINWSNGEDTRPPNSVNHNIYWLNLFSITMCCIRSKVTPGLEQKIAPEITWWL